MAPPHPDDLSQVLQAWSTLPVAAQHAVTSLGGLFVGLLAAYLAIGRTVWEIKGMVKTLHDDHDQQIVDHQELERLRRRFARFEKDAKQGVFSHPARSVN